jgi:hypothetical protein
MNARGTGVAKDEARAVELFKKACDAGHAGGCSSLGVMYDEGRGVAKDEAGAVELYWKACDGGDAQGCFMLGTVYIDGKRCRERRSARRADLPDSL